MELRVSKNMHMHTHIPKTKTWPDLTHCFKTCVV